MLLNLLSILFLLIGANCQTHLKSMTTKIYIGAGITADHLSESNYTTIMSQNFNFMTPGNEMKWDAIESSRGQVNYANADKLVQYAQNNSMKTRGHTLIWHSQLPGWVSTLNKTDLHTVMVKHITDTVTHFKGKLYAWDVVNEIFNDDGTYRDTLWYKNFGTDFVAEAFKTAHAADPTVKLYINDYNVEGKNKKSDAIYNLVKSFKSTGVPIDGVGFQAHFIAGQFPQDIQSNLQRFTDLGVEVAITELDIRVQLPSTSQTEEQQAKDYASTFKACISVPKCVGITIWGITDKYSWIPDVFSGYGDALLFDKNFKPKTVILSAIQTVLK